MKKRVLIITAMLLLTFSPLSAFAFDRDYTPGASFNWSPYNWALTHYRSYSDSSQVVASFSDIQFSQTAADIHNNGYYLTFEINNKTDNVPHSGWYTSNMPYAYYDTDDDNKNGYAEEVEVIKSYVGAKIVAKQSYYFQTSWKLSNSKSGTFDMVVQRSGYNPVNGEYEGIHFDLIGSHKWSN